MSVQEETNKHIITRLMSKWNESDLSAFFDGFTSDCVFRLFSNYDTPVAKIDFQNLMKAASDAFPDMKIHVEQLIAEGDNVMIRVINSGTHTGQWQNIPATGKRVTYRELVIFRLNSEGKIAEWVYHPDLPSLFQQLGARP